MRKSSIVMLVAAILLGLAAVFFARMFLLAPSGNDARTGNVRTVSAVVASAPVAFGEKLTPDKLKVVQWPANGIPAGSFQRVADALGDNNRVALRAIDANELVTDKALSGKNGRMSSSPLLGATMRAISVPVSEAAGAAGFVVPGDRVDVYLTRGAEEENQPYTDLLMQDVRVLAVGQDANVGKDKPEIVKTATIEVTPLQAQKAALAMTVGQLTLSLRNLVDESHVRLETAQLLDLNDGIVTHIVRKPRGGSGSAPANDQVRSAEAMGSALGSALRNSGAGGAGAAKPVLTGPSIEIYRGTKPTSYPVPSGS